MRILYITTIGGTMGFFIPFITELVKEHHTVDIATNEMNGKNTVPKIYRELGCKVYQIDCSRNPFNKGNLKAIAQIRKIVAEGDYDIVHCHTPNAAACTRLACKKARKNGTRVFYTAHGFHFYKGAPAMNWILFFPVEKTLSKYTDTLITINKEDFDIASKKFHAKRVFLIPGMGVNTKKFMDCHVDIAKKREELGIRPDIFALFSAGELNLNKNHKVVIEALAKCADPDIHYYIAGRGQSKEALQHLSQSLNISEQVHLLDYRSDIPEILHAVNVFVCSSIREGQGIATIEAMAAGLPVITSDNRGLRGILIEEENALICRYDDCEGFANAIRKLKNDPVLMRKMSENNRKLSAQFDISIANETMKQIYAE